MFWNVGYTLKVIVASIAKVSRTKAEKHCHTTTVATLVFQVVCTVFRTHLGPRHITAAPANQFFGVVVVTLSSVCVALGFAAVVSFPAFVADVVCVAFQRETCGIIIESGTFSHDGITFRKPLVFQPHQRLLFDIFVKGVNGIH